MANELKNACGTTGKMSAEFTQSDMVAMYVKNEQQKYVIKQAKTVHAYVRKGACHGMCIYMMTCLKLKKEYKPREGLEIAQWIHEVPSGEDRDLRISLLAQWAGLASKDKVLYGKLCNAEGEIFLSNALTNFQKLPAFYVFGFSSSDYSKGHALLIFREEDEKIFLMDPNFGVAVWPHTNGLLVGLKKLLKSDAYRKTYGPYYSFELTTYE